MTHTVPESDVHTSRTWVEEVGKPRVLVVAYPDLTDAICEALDLDKRSLGQANTVRHTREQRSIARTVSTLCWQTFPSGEKEQLSNSKVNGTFKTGLKRLLKAIGKVFMRSAKPPAHSEESPISLFEWGDYDFIIIQDLWVNRPKSTPATLEAMGYELAHLDYYERGNFNTKKIILITDYEFPTKKWERESGERSEGFNQILRIAFDEKDALALVELNSPNAIVQLRDIIFGRFDSGYARNGEKVPTSGRVSESAWNGGRTAPVYALRYRVKREITEALRLYVKTRAEVIFVDDELKELALTYSEVTGERLTFMGVQGASQDGEGQHPDKCVLIASSSGRTASTAQNFERLVDLCERKFSDAIEGGKDYVLFVTDILFKLKTWNKTGIDLIEELRRRLKLSAAGRFGIVAFTGFSTPFIAMSSYQRGADFVVPKNIDGRHDTSTLGTDRLLMTLAALCFQKSYLQNKRREAVRNKDAKDSIRQSSENFAQSLRHLQAVLPRHAVSLHLQQEWLDTCYLLDAMTIYELGSPQLERVFQEMGEKYA